MTSRRVAKFLGGAWLCMVALAGLFTACDGKSAKTSDSETHFLETCTDTCSGGLTCLCGVCTKPCTAQAGCGDLSSSASCEDSCSESSSKVCDVACNADGDCASLGAAFGCSAGHCRQDSAQGAGGGAGDGGNAGAGVTNAGGGGTGAVVGSGGAGPLSACHAQPDLTPSIPAPTALDPDLVARAAAVIGSCMPDDGVARNAAHLWLEHLRADGMLARFGAQLDCFANAACGCDAIEHCLSWVYRLIPADCVDGCEGDIVTGCGDGTVVTADCSRFGLSCDPAGACVADALVACDVSEAPTCSAQGEVEFCDISGFRRKTPCQSLGFDCVAGKCVGDGAACPDTSSRFDDVVEPVGSGCSGATLQACVGGQTTTIDCATQGPGFSCQSFDGSFFCGLAAECLPAGNFADTQAPTCDGTVLTFCNAGRLEHLDCTTLGFTACDIDSKIGHYGCTPILDVQ